MGVANVKELEKGQDQLSYLHRLLDDIKALEKMLEQKMIEKSPIRIGAEQEFCLVGDHWEPSDKALEILKTIDDHHFTSELALFNLEINLDPLELKGDCFSKMAEQLKTLLKKADKAAAQHGDKTLLTGILPTLTRKHMDLRYMTPINRYLLLNKKVQEIRKEAIELHIKGVDEINIHHDSIMYEGCNTSFQAHLQIDPDDFKNSYNWAQAIAGPVLAICTNSPLLMGKELWEESRIALFTQSVDTRTSTFLLNERESRVGFGNAWCTGTAADFYKESIVRFRSLLNTVTDQNTSTSQVEEGKVPPLKALNLHNSTVYKWNRLCYGVADGKAHLRIENRYMPSGPSVDDEIANMMLWVGLMNGRPKHLEAIDDKMDFRDAKNNFFHAARYGMASQFYWEGKRISSKDLLSDVLLPMAFRGLYRMKVSPQDAEKYLTIIEKRIRTVSGSRWLVEAYRKLQKKHHIPDAIRLLTATMYERQQKGYTVDSWLYPRGDEALKGFENRTVSDQMKTKVLTAQDADSAELVLRIMEWNNIHHVPILDDNEDLVGILSSTDFETAVEGIRIEEQRVADLMSKQLVTVTESTPLGEARDLMESHQVHSLLVVHGKKLVGILSSKDLA